LTSDISMANENWVFQSNKLIEASYTLTVTEQKMVRLLASMIKKDDDDFKEYKFKAKDLIKLLNTSDSRFYRDIDNITDLLMQRIIKIREVSTRGFEKYHWVDVAKYRDGVLTLKINKDLKPFYLSLDWYTKYQLKNIMQFKSTYSFRLYELLKQYEGIGYRELTIEQLRTILDIGKDQYPKYANLKQKVINVAVDEINKNTDIYILFTPQQEIKTARKVTSIKFIITKNKAIHESAITSTAIEKDEEDPDEVNVVKEVQAIFHNHKISVKEAMAILKDSKNNIDLITECYKYALTKDIDNIVGYVRTIVKGFNQPQKNKKQSSFNNFEQRQYNFSELEKKLLGWE
jgi:plasmid replication initiation protein